MNAAPTSKAIRSEMRAAERDAAGSVSAERARRAIYDAMRHRYGEAAVGAWEGYATKAAGFWTLEACKTDALRFQTRQAWARESPRAYVAAHRRGWLDECCAHMAPTGRAPYRKWTREECRADALRFQSRGTWQAASPTIYGAARRNGWLAECCGHMPQLQMPKGHWTLAACQADAQRFRTPDQWKRGSGGAHYAAQQNGWLAVCTAHMTDRKKPNGWWTLERCRADALRFQTRADWDKGSPGAAETAYRKGWLAACCAHMPERPMKPRSFWTLDTCKTDALRFPTRGEWRRGSASAYAAAERNGWLDACCGHMNEARKPAGHWTLDACRADALRFATRTAWQRASGSAYDAAVRHGWLNDCTTHMGEPFSHVRRWTLEACQEDARRFRSRKAWKLGSNGFYAAREKGWLDLCEHDKAGGLGRPQRDPTRPLAPTRDSCLTNLGRAP